MSDYVIPEIKATEAEMISIRSLFTCQSGIKS